MKLALHIFVHVCVCVCVCMRFSGGVFPHATEAGPGGEQHWAPAHPHHLQLQEATGPPHPQALTPQAHARHPR